MARASGPFQPPKMALLKTKARRVFDRHGTAPLCSPDRPCGQEIGSKLGAKLGKVRRAQAAKRPQAGQYKGRQKWKRFVPTCLRCCWPLLRTDSCMACKGKAAKKPHTWRVKAVQCKAGPNLKRVMPAVLESCGHSLRTSGCKGAVDTPPSVGGRLPISCDADSSLDPCRWAATILKRGTCHAFTVGPVARQPPGQTFPHHTSPGLSTWRTPGGAADAVNLACRPPHRGRTNVQSEPGSEADGLPTHPTDAAKRAGEPGTPPQAWEGLRGGRQKRGTCL
jgi:hypothetical protein